MSRYASPILTSLLDTDAYKLHMQQAVFHRYPSVHVTAEFRCRGEENLTEYAEQIRHQLHLMGDLSLTEAEYHYLAGLPFFQQDYLDWLRTFRFRPEQVTITTEHQRLSIRISGPWLEVILWEVPLLAVISEIVHRHRSPHISPQHAVAHLHHKLQQFHAESRAVDLGQFRLMDFGTRRRFSKCVHQEIISILKQQCEFFVGTSNYALARELDLSPMGTQAHEWFQAHQQIAATLADSQRAALEAWLEEYLDKLGIALTDCISMDAFLRDFNLSFATRYQGLRHDSGDPVAWGEKAIAHYQQLNIDPHSKTLVFSDNLDLGKSLALYQHFFSRVQLGFGIGTRLTCDIPTVTPLNIVIKLVECNGRPVAKLSDSPGKTICHDPAFVQALQKAFSLSNIQQAS